MEDYAIKNFVEVKVGLALNVGTFAKSAANSESQGHTCVEFVSSMFSIISILFTQSGTLLKVHFLYQSQKCLNLCSNLLMKHSTNLEILLNKLSRYSSGDNAQPFFFKINEVEKSIIVYHDARIAEHILNPNNYASLISLGIIIQMMEELSKHFNFEWNFDLTLTEAELGKKELVQWGVFKLTMADGQIESDEIFLNVGTNRNIYKDEKVPNIFINDGIYISDKLTKDETVLVIKAESQAWSNYKVFNNIFHWVHLSQDTYKKERSGFHYSEINMRFFETPFAMIFKCAWLTKIFINLPGVKLITSHKSKLILNKTPNVVGIFASIKQPLDLILAGRKVYEAKYTLAKYGFTTQPLSLTTFPFIYRKLNVEIFNTRSLDEKIQVIFKKKFNNSDPDQDLVWMMRAGIPQFKMPLSLKKTNEQILIHF